MVTCINCRAVLAEIGAGQFRCPECRLIYPGEVLIDVDPVEWERISSERLFCLECDQVLPGLPRVHMNRKGDPVPCPTHDPRRRRWWHRLRH